MKTLEIHKKSLKTWLHIDNITGEFIISKFYFNANGLIFQIVEDGEAKLFQYLVSDITLYDDTASGTPETFSNITDLSLRLEELNYPAFFKDGQTPIPSLNDLTNVVIIGATDGQVLAYDFTSSKWVNVDLGAISVPDATTTVKGKLKLAGDLGGTADLPTVPNKADKTTEVNGHPLSGDVNVSLQDVTDVGNSTTNPIIIKDPSDPTKKYIEINGTDILVYDKNIDLLSPLAYYRADSFYCGLEVGVGARYIPFVGLVDEDELNAGYYAKNYQAILDKVTNKSIVFGYPSTIDDDYAITWRNKGGNPAFTDEIPTINEHYRGTYTSESALNIAVPTGNAGDYAIVNPTGGVVASQWIWDDEGSVWVEGGSVSLTTTDALTEGTTNLYFTDARALAVANTMNPTDIDALNRSGSNASATLDLEASGQGVTGVFVRSPQLEIDTNGISKRAIIKATNVNADTDFEMPQSGGMITTAIFGNLSATGTATTTFTVTLPFTPPAGFTVTSIVPKNALTAVMYYVNNETSNTFDVVFVTGLTGTVNFNWEVIPN